LPTTASSTAWTSVGELEMTLNISEVAVLLVQCLIESAGTRFEFLLQLCLGFASTVNVSSRLRSLQTKTGNARSALLPFATQGHLVEKATGPVDRPKIEALNLNRTARRTRGVSLDHLVGGHEQTGRHVEAERSGRLQVDNKLELGRLRNR